MSHSYWHGGPCTPVQISGNDRAGNNVNCSFQVCVEDTTPPTIACPGDQVYETSSPEGIRVDFDVKVYDLADPNPAIICDPPSGKLFESGVHRITCTATDSQGNSKSCEFTVTVTLVGGQIPGDCNQDGLLDISDGVCLLGNLFLGDPEELPCGDPGTTDMLDCNADDAVDVSDAVCLLGYLFLGTDPHPDGTECTEFEGCMPACD